MLTIIKNKLNELIEADPEMDGTSYGVLPVRPQNYNYLVLSRKNIRKSDKDFNEYYVVSVVREDFIPDGYVYDVIQKVLEIKGLKLANEDIQFAYTRKNKTDVVVEIASITFTKAKKKGAVM